MAERFIGTLLREWADPGAYRPTPSASPLSRSLSTSTISAARTPALGGLPLVVVVNHVRGDHI